MASAPHTPSAKADQGGKCILWRLVLPSRRAQLHDGPYGMHVAWGLQSQRAIVAVCVSYVIFLGPWPSPQPGSILELHMVGSDTRYPYRHLTTPNPLASAPNLRHTTASRDTLSVSRCAPPRGIPIEYTYVNSTERTGSGDKMARSVPFATRPRALSPGHGRRNAQGGTGS